MNKRQLLGPATFIACLTALVGPWFVTRYIVQVHLGLGGLVGAIASWAVWLLLAGIACWIVIFGICFASWFLAGPRGKRAGAAAKEEGLPAGPVALLASNVYDELEEMDGVELEDESP
jgi:hypothetical protein